MAGHVSVSYDRHLTRRVALVTGANCGIGAATGIELAARGATVLLRYLRLEPAGAEGGTPPAYAQQRARDATWVLETIRAAGGHAEAVEADLADPAAPALLLDRAEATLGPVEIVVCNASGWVQDTFTPVRHDPFGRPMQPVTAATFESQFAVDARSTALLIAEFSRRHIARGADWGRIVSLTSGGPDGFPNEVSYGAARLCSDDAGFVTGNVVRMR